MVALKRNATAPAAKKQVADYIQGQHGLSQRRAASLAHCAPKSLRYKSKRADELPVRERLRKLAQERPRFGYRRLHVLLRREGTLINRKKTHRLYREEKLHLRPKKRRRRGLGERVQPERPTAPNQMWRGTLWVGLCPRYIGLWSLVSSLEHHGWLES